jgi:AcrR family transcriptional regulator
MKNSGELARSALIDNALQLFSVKGYFNTSVNDILSGTGLTKGAFYYHFKTKEEIWNAAYEEALNIWRKIIFKGVREIEDPIDRIIRVIENNMRDYVGSDNYNGGAFFFNMLSELSGQSETMCDFVMKGFDQLSEFIYSWLNEANNKGLLRPGLNLHGIAEFIVISMNGATVLHAAKQDRKIWLEACNQLCDYLREKRA